MHLGNRLSAHYRYAIIKTPIANLGKLTALSEEAVSLISGNYSPYSKVGVRLVTSIENNGANSQIQILSLNRERLYLNYSLQKN